MNPWEATTLEWSIANPIPHGNFPKQPVVYRPAYEYSVPGRTTDFWPQHLAPEPSAVGADALKKESPQES